MFTSEEFARRLLARTAASAAAAAQADHYSAPQEEATSRPLLLPEAAAVGSSWTATYAVTTVKSGDTSLPSRLRQSCVSFPIETLSVLVGIDATTPYLFEISRVDELSSPVVTVVVSVADFDAPDETIVVSSELYKRCGFLLEPNQQPPARVSVSLVSRTIPKGIRAVLKSNRDTFYSECQDPRALLEMLLSGLLCLSVGEIITAHSSSGSGTPQTDFEVMKLFAADHQECETVLIHDTDLEIDFDTIEIPQPPLQPPPQPPERRTTPTILPNHRGEIHRLNQQPQSRNPYNIPVMQQSSGVVPFSGIGRRLCD